jgi:hypothetical protein
MTLHNGKILVANVPSHTPLNINFRRALIGNNGTIGYIYVNG